MSNAAILARMSELLARFETGRVTAEQVERQFESHLSALEGIQSRNVSEARKLTYELVRACADEGEPDAQLDRATVLGKLRAFLASLPT